MPDEQNIQPFDSAQDKPAPEPVSQTPTEPEITPQSESAPTEPENPISEPNPAPVSPQQNPHLLPSSLNPWKPF